MNRLLGANEMNTVEKKRTQKTKPIFAVSTAIIATLAISSLWLFMRTDSLQIQVGNLQTENDSFQASIVSLQSEVSNLTIAKGSLQSELASLTQNNTDLQSQIDDLMEEIDDMELEIWDLEWEIYNLQQTAEENRFEFYYASLAKQRFGVYDLDEYLDRWEWIEGTYVKGVFDCSEMSAYIEWRLENEGYNTYIVCGESPWGGGYHAWLLVETSEGAYMPVEATEYDVVWWSDLYFDNYFEYDYLFETIRDALDYSYSEFDWWN